MGTNKPKNDGPFNPDEVKTNIPAMEITGETNEFPDDASGVHVAQDIFEETGPHQTQDLIPLDDEDTIIDVTKANPAKADPAKENPSSVCNIFLFFTFYVTHKLIISHSLTI